MSAKTNSTTFSYGIEPSFKADPSVWKIIEPNTIPTFGATISKISRNPISPNRQNRKSAIADVDSAVSMEFDVTVDGFEDFLEGLMFANFQTGPDEMIPTAVTATAYTIPAGVAHPAGTLVYARNFSDPANNGFKVVDAASTTTSVIIVGGLAIEASSC